MVVRTGVPVAALTVAVLAMGQALAAPENGQAPKPVATPAEAAVAPAPKPATPEASVPSPGRDKVRLRALVREQALKSGLPPQIADAVAEVESAYNISASGSYGEVGLMQVLPSTARMLGFSGSLAELAEPATNIRYGITYLTGAWRLAGGDICTTVMKYRAGHGETRFSYRSVHYCQRVRAILTAQGYPVTGEVPTPTFGDPVVGAIGPVARGKTGRRKSRVNWATYDSRMRNLTKVGSSTLRIMQ
ncbi:MULTISPECIES: transglycosylase SLT domain-containing protein [unclassified Chelatococcus]|jgi:soluble lytic murein transglycosylase-like protein|uniref:lytic transglycosylase domain-containing protein n=1 Tax=unclassified Chelatococcus TaxID=2638111 RepID=UPI0020BE9D2A|nr:MULTISPECIES: transglycosylase SLT domain-containing protein [unclassified Chelatococcus]MCO5078553.1 transglycosylase SLT domain-containing protein [Chelatococcus sp.]CAH1653658.1 Transglycosylase-like protein with SLT domain [Hyphomicrobiales bacterium]CAH1685644.1 Transglycosylase-like protein with SLT domain [Hyphomicrobiales bacterium]